MKVKGKSYSEISTQATNNSIGFYIGALILLVYGYSLIVISSEGISVFGNIISKWGEGAYDANGPKFLFLSIWNIISLALLYILKDFRKSEGFFGFFSNRIGLAYTAVMLFTLLSFFKAINFGEAIIHFSKIFTGFTAAWVTAVIIYRYPKLVAVLAIGLTLITIKDSVGVFIQKYQGATVYEMKQGYSNKNILTSALFVKIPFALWLVFFVNRKKILGIIGMIIGVLGIGFGTLSILYLNTRAFYMATVITFFIMLIYALTHFIISRDKRLIKGVAIYAAILVSAFSVYAFTQYVESINKQIEEVQKIQQVSQPSSQVVQQGENPAKNTIKTAAWDQFWKSFSSRVKSIFDTTRDKSNTQRLDAWRWSIKMIMKDPILGVGAGNWKVRVLEYENQQTPEYVYMYKNHNDFLEVPAEIGVFGGIAFVLIFIFTGIYFAKSVFQKNHFASHKMLFLPAFGLFAYSFDAFFNFPQDRPEILLLFSMYVGIASVAVSLFYGKERFLQAEQISKLLNVKYLSDGSVVLCGVLLIISACTLKLNNDSLYIQRRVATEKYLKENYPEKYKLIDKLTAEQVEKGYPIIPNLSAVAQPVSIEKALYYIQEKKYDKALDILHKDGGKNSPWDGRVYYFLGATYYQFEKNKPYDSIEYYMRKTIELKPKFYPAVSLLQDALVHLGRPKEAIEEIKSYLDRYKKEPKAWNQLARLYEQYQMIPQLNDLMDSAKVYVAYDKDVQRNIQVVREKYKNDFTKEYDRAVTSYSAGKYKEAEALFTEILTKITNNPDIYALRAVCNYHIGQYKQAISDFNQQERLGKPLIAATINIRAACYYMIGDTDNAKKYFKQAMKQGDKQAEENYKKLFGNS